ncbi:hypothetical protein PsYK624_082830 [Phanerochaete sordida]|uniref:BTB domain-containing protein n=1 Tax=Phanerochaete sordida TaxID=48140 RepID=A0A9P3GE66_9APHY|nr:hypothetical protein PsYK624_082830 [Phanerochaete sordida]
MSRFRKSSGFYFEDLFLCAEDTLFKVVHQDFVDKSDVFKDMFALPRAGTRGEGSSAEHPLVLQGIKAADLEDFLSVLYPRRSDLAPMPLARWKAAYRLASMWEFEDVRAQALGAFKEHLKTASSTDAVALHQELGLDVDADFVQAVLRIVVRTEDLTPAEAEELGMPVVMRVCTLRGWFSATHDRAALPRRICAAWGVPYRSPRAQRRPSRAFADVDSDGETECQHQ